MLTVTPGPRPVVLHADRRARRHHRQQERDAAEGLGHGLAGKDMIAAILMLIALETEAPALRLVIWS